MKTWIADQAFQKMCHEASALHPLESGGILLGWRSGDNRVVVDIRGPGPYALHGRHRFVPDHPWQINQIQAAFAESQGDLDYLGDWHSHPDGTAAMSEEDKSTLRRICKRVDNSLMFIIAGGEKSGWSAGCWRGGLHRSFISRRFEIRNQDIAIFDPPESWFSTWKSPPS